MRREWNQIDRPVPAQFGPGNGIIQRPHRHLGLVREPVPAQCVGDTVGEGADFLEREAPIVHHIGKPVGIDLPAPI